MGFVQLLLSVKIHKVVVITHPPHKTFSKDQQSNIFISLTPIRTLKHVI